MTTTDRSRAGVLFQAEEAEGGPRNDEGTVELDLDRRGDDWWVEVASAGSVRAQPLPRTGALVIGSSAGADLPVADRSVSARHLRIVASPAGIAVEDLGSRNGLFLAGARVSGAEVGAGGGAFVAGRTSVVVRQRPASLGEAEPLPGMVGRSLAMRQFAWAARRYAPLSRPVLIQGESGTGKDLVARALHLLSRRGGAFLPLNVSTVPEALADAEVFGHQRGAFTGAVSARPGAFEACHRGTLFLDEVAELSPALQAKLLRVVEDGEIRPVGSQQPKHVDVRLVAASWMVLRERVQDGAFREDLYHRLAQLELLVPPLRDRVVDIPDLAAALLSRHQHELGPRTPSPAALSRLQAHRWPGNVRELGAVLYRAAVASPGPRIEIAAVEAAIGVNDGDRRADALGLLAAHDGNVSAAARAAGLPRSTFRARLARARRRHGDEDDRRSA